MSLVEEIDGCLRTYSAPGQLVEECPERERPKGLSTYALGTMLYWQQEAIPDRTYVYFAGVEDANGDPFRFTKIGFAADPAKRVAELQCGIPWELKVWQVVLADRALETYLHQHWRRLRVRGEWFYHDDPRLFVRRAQNAATEQMVEHDYGCRDPRRLKWTLPASILTPDGDW